ncbi:hypothetical protein ACFL43_06435 [Thermodesulfobacteriota bacterium]
MPLKDSIYFIAFCVFLAGAALNLRGYKPRRSLWIMVVGVLIDFFATVLPHTGFKSLAIGIGTSPAIIAGIVLGVVVWTLFLAAVFVRLTGRVPLFCVMIALVKVLWFSNLVLCLHGVYDL